MTHRRKIIAANWKMNKTIAECQAFVDSLKSGARSVTCELIVFPPFFAVPRVADLLRGSGVSVGAQDLFWEAGSGAYTGEISGDMIRDAGGSYVLVGHSERRHVVGEDIDIVAKKLAAALSADLKPILCVGEMIEHREEGEHEEYVRIQLDTALSGLSEAQMSRIVVAYEPVWAIGTGKTATPEDAVGMHAMIRNCVKAMFGDDFGEALCIQYGGSVKPDNAASLLTEPEIDGALIGGASLNVESFLAIAAAVP